MQNVEVSTRNTDMYQFKQSLEPIFNLEIFLSSDRFQTKRDTLQLISLIGAYGGFTRAMGLFGTRLIAGLSRRNFNAQLRKASSLNDLTLRTYEIYMLAYLWSCCLISKRFKKIKEANNKVKESLDFEKLFWSLE